MNLLIENEAKETEALWLRAQGADISRWPDSRLTAAVCGNPLDKTALDALIARHWKGLFARCRMLTPDSRQACNLAKAACVRLLTQRRSLGREGDFGAILIRHALAIWRSQHSLPTGEQGVTGSCIADSDSGSFEGVNDSRLTEETDFALRQLTAFELDVVLSICVDDESTDDVARRYNLPEEKIRAGLERATPVLATSFAAWSCACRA